MTSQSNVYQSLSQLFAPLTFIEDRSGELTKEEFMTALDVCLVSNLHVSLGLGLGSSWDGRYKISLGNQRRSNG